MRSALAEFGAERVGAWLPAQARGGVLGAGHAVQRRLQVHGAEQPAGALGGADQRPAPQRPGSRRVGRTTGAHRRGHDPGQRATCRTTATSTSAPAWWNASVSGCGSARSTAADADLASWVEFGQVSRAGAARHPHRRRVGQPLVGAIRIAAHGQGMGGMTLRAARRMAVGQRAAGRGCAGTSRRGVAARRRAARGACSSLAPVLRDRRAQRAAPQGSRAAGCARLWRRPAHQAHQRRRRGGRQRCTRTGRGQDTGQDQPAPGLRRQGRLPGVAVRSKCACRPNPASPARSSPSSSPTTPASRTPRCMCSRPSRHGLPRASAK